MFIVLSHTSVIILHHCGHYAGHWNYDNPMSKKYFMAWQPGLTNHPSMEILNPENPLQRRYSRLHVKLPIGFQENLFVSVWLA